MKRGIVAAVSVALILLLVAASVAAADAPIRVKVNGQYLAMDTDPVNVNGRVMVPARFVAEALGADVSWDQQNQTVVVDNKMDELLTLSDGELDDARAWWQQHKPSGSLIGVLPPGYEARSPSRLIPSFDNRATLMTPWAYNAIMADQEWTPARRDSMRTLTEYRLFFVPVVVTNKPNGKIDVVLRQGDKVVSPYRVSRQPAERPDSFSGIYYFWGVGLRTSVPVEATVTTEDASATFTYDLSQLK